MTEFYIGFRIEVGTKFIIRNFSRRANSASKTTKVLDIYKNGKIGVEKRNGVLLAHGEKTDAKVTVTNFALVAPVKSETEAIRIAKIINILGNDRLIREKVSVFVNSKSTLNGLPELVSLKMALIRIESIAPGIVKNGWYYAPEIIEI